MEKRCDRGHGVKAASGGIASGNPILPAVLGTCTYQSSRKSTTVDDSHHPLTLQDRVD